MERFGDDAAAGAGGWNRWEDRGCEEVSSLFEFFFFSLEVGEIFEKSWAVEEIGIGVCARETFDERQWYNGLKPRRKSCGFTFRHYLLVAPLSVCTMSERKRRRSFSCEEFVLIPWTIGY